MDSYDVIVVGLGAMGSSALYHASRRGLKVLGIEQFNEIPHKYGSHHGSTRIIRKVYFEHPGYVPLLLRAYELWERLEQEVGESLLVKSGGLMIGSPSSEVVSGALLAADRHGLSYERFTKKELEKRYPWFTLDDSHEAVFEPDAGYLFSELAVRSHVGQAVRFGAEVRLGYKVEGWSQSGNGIEIKLGSETVFAQRLILTVGAWAPQFLYNRQLSVERQVLHWFASAPDDVGNVPIYIIEEDDGSTFYAFPNIPSQGIKVAIHHGGDISTVNKVDREVHPLDIERMRHALSRRVPSLASRALVKSSACMYTNTPDFHFIVGPLPEQENVILGLGFSGHGFKFSSVMGELLTNMSQDEDTLPIPEIFAPDRFTNTQ